MGSNHLWRYTIIGAFLTVLAGIILIQMIRLQLNPEEVGYFKDLGYDRVPQMVIPARGLLYDRYGHELAANAKVYEVGLELGRVKNPHTVALALNVLLGLDYSQVYETATQEPSSKLVYAVVADFVSKEQIDRLEKYKEEIQKTYGGARNKDAPSLNGLVYRAHLQRSYPERSVGSNLLGFVNREGQGVFGVEAKYNDLLAGKAQKVMMPRDPTWSASFPISRTAPASC